MLNWFHGVRGVDVVVVANGKLKLKIKVHVQIIQSA